MGGCGSRDKNLREKLQLTEAEFERCSKKF